MRSFILVMETVSSDSLRCPEKCTQQWHQQKPRWDICIHTHKQPAFECATSSFSFVAVTYSPAYDSEGLEKDFKFALMEKENTPDKKEAEKLLMNTDSGKQFMCFNTADTAGKWKYHPNIGCWLKWTGHIFVNHWLIRLSVSPAAYSDDMPLKEKHKVSSSAAEGRAGGKCRITTEI